MGEAAENLPDTAVPDQLRDHAFEPGKSGNPGGRPKGLAKRVRERVGENGDALITSMLAIATNLSGKEKSSDIIAANAWLADRGWGKAPMFAPVEEDDPLELSERAANEIAADFDSRIVVLERRRKQRPGK